MTSQIGPILINETLAYRPAGTYRVLHYPGDITGELLPGQILGADVFGRPFEVLDAELEPAPEHYHGDGCVQVHELEDGTEHWSAAPGHERTVVQLQYATPESIARAVAELRALAGVL